MSPSQITVPLAHTGSSVVLPSSPVEESTAVVLVVSALVVSALVVGALVVGAPVEGSSGPGALVIGGPPEPPLPSVAAVPAVSSPQPVSASASAPTRARRAGEKSGCSLVSRSLGRIDPPVWR